MKLLKKKKKIKSNFNYDGLYKMPLKFLGI